jgi:hypothetical protein
MMKIPFIVFILILQANLYSQSYFSQTPYDVYSFSRFGNLTDARGMSMGNAMSVLSDNYSAVVLNPATLGLSRNITANVTFGLNLYRNEATFLDSVNTSHKTETVLNQAGFVFPLSGDSASHNVVLAVGFNQSKNLNRIFEFSGYNTLDNTLIKSLTANNSPVTRRLKLSYPRYLPGTNEYLGEETILNNNLQENASVFDEGTLNHWSLGFAYEFAYNIFFGFSANYIVGSNLSNREFSEDNTGYYPDTLATFPGDLRTEGFQKFYLTDIVNQVYNGVDFRFGVLYKFFNFISIGGSVKTPSIIAIDEEHYFKGGSVFASGFNPLVDSVVTSSYTIRTPYEFTGAAAVNIFFLTGAAEVSYVDYTEMRFSGGLDIPQSSELTKEILDSYTRVLNLKAGAEFRLPFTGISARAGFMYFPSPIKNDDPVYDRKYLTAGAGIKSGEGSMEFNVAYIVGWWQEKIRDYGNDIPPITSNVRTDNIIGSFILRF